jgi:hypothetical protein
MTPTPTDSYARKPDDGIRQRVATAKRLKENWKSLWDDCYRYALPQRSMDTSQDGARRTQNIYDGTAPDAVDQLAASLLANLTPPWSNWFGLRPGPALNKGEAERLAPVLGEISQILQSHFDRSNFAVEIHQSYLDLVTAGTASLLFEEEDPGSYSAFRFTALPLSNITLTEDHTGRLANSYRERRISLSDLVHEYGANGLPADLLAKAGDVEKNDNSNGQHE